MDVLGACQAFVYVSERGSFTTGAAAARMSQPVVSRRIAALERHFGGTLFDRSSRRATLTPFGRAMLPSAKRLVRLAEAMNDAAVRAKLSPLRLAVPDTCPPRDLAQLAAEARTLEIYLDFQAAPPQERRDLVRSLDVRAALVALPAGDGQWTVPLGLASAVEPQERAVYVETLRPGRGDSGSPRRIWIQPEDDVPHIRDRIIRLRDAVGLWPVQVAVAGAPTTAVAEVLASTDVLLCSAKEARELGLHWRPMGEVEPMRGYDVLAEHRDDALRLGSHLGTSIGRCLGAPDSEASTR
ncbi:LysR family transcriptional regulator [Phytoactinopolyspora mesophila]|uniref:LysR family transcriptional regulator n=1 Tax=Phytoactinopolyspora mesophila TaxID=2650750 RepID=A0A7K3LZW9_9ACTN|nr:LysR family transcriptional regulator [Phytoactinopolyspora mesophila]